MKLTFKYISKHELPYTNEGAIYFTADKPLDQSLFFKTGERAVKEIQRIYNDEELLKATGLSITDREEKAKSFVRLVIFLAGLAVGLLIGGLF